MKPLILNGHHRPIRDIKFNKESDLMFTGSADKSIVLWAAETGERIGTFLHDAAISTMNITRDSKILIAGDTLGSVYFWSVNTGKLLKKTTFESKNSINNIRSMDLSFGDKEALIVYANRNEKWSNLDIFNMDDIMSYSTDKINLEKFPPVKRLTENVSKFNMAKFTDCNHNIIYTQENGTIGRRNILTGETIVQNKVHKDLILDMDISSMHEVILTSSKDHSINVLNAKTMEVINSYEPKNPVRNINACRISPLFSLGSGEDDGYKFHCAFAGGQESRDVTTTTSREGGFEILLYNMMFGEEFGAIHAHFGPVNTLAFSPNGKLLASGSEDASIKVHKLDDDYYQY